MDWVQRINEMAWGYKNAAILLNALRAGIFEALGEESKTAAEVAQACALDERATNIVLCALVAAEVVIKDGDYFATVAAARPVLLADSPTTLKSILSHNLFMLRNWAYLDEVLQSGQPARKEAQSRQQMEDFILGMENISRLSSQDVADKIDLSGAGRLLDLGGGPGTAAITFARANPKLQCVVFDQAGPVEIARDQIAQAQLSDRIGVASGDFHTDEIGTGFDVVYISNIIHMLDPDHTLELFRKARRALRPGGRLLLKDFFLADSRTAPAKAAQFSVNMLVNTEGGKTYTRSETLALLTEAGFGDFESVAVAAQSEVIVAMVPD